MSFKVTKESLVVVFGENEQKMLRKNVSSTPRGEGDAKRFTYILKEFKSFFIKVNQLSEIHNNQNQTIRYCM